MLAFLNGKLIPESRATVSIFDRGFLYGDGLFETIRVVGGKPFRWREHWERLEDGANYLKIKLPFNQLAALRHAQSLIKKNKMRDSLLRVTVSRGIGVRGYSPNGATRPTFAMSLHDAPKMANNPAQWKLITASFRIASDVALARFKTANKLPQILARAEADAAGADEVLMVDSNGFVMEGASSNLFWIERRTVFTPPAKDGVLPGVTRGVVCEICKELRIRIEEKNIRPKDLKRADGVFLSLTSLGIVEAKSLDGTFLRRSLHVNEITGAYNGLLVGAGFET